MLAGSIANAKLSNSSVTINSNVLSLGNTLTLDTNDIGEGSSNLYYTQARFDSAFTAKSTSDLSEGSNLYYTDARARAAISEDSTQLSYNSTTGVLSFTQGDTDTVSEGSSNLYYTQARFDSSFSAKTTADLTENTNLYYTTARANTDFDTRLATKDTGDLTEGSNLYYTSSRANTDFDTRLATKSTTDLAEGTNLYYTSARFDSALTSKDTDDLSEGSTNLYYTTARFDSAFGNKTTADLTENTNLYYTDTRANSAIDARVTKAFVDALNVQAASVDANSVALGTDTTGNYIQTITGTANKITVTGSGSESADVTLTLPDDVQIADSLTVAGNLTVNGTLTSLDTTNLDIEDNLFQLNAGLTGSPVNDSGMLINRGNQNNGIFMWDESVDKFTLGLTTADGTSTGNITLASLGTLVANIEGNVTGTVSSISNHSTSDLTEGSNLYYTDARVEAVSINNVVEDTTPQLGGNLASNGNNILFADNDKAIFGAGSDLEIYSDGGSNNYILSNNGALILRNLSDDKDIYLQSDDGAGGFTSYLHAKGSSGEIILKHYGSNKLATTSTGINVTGTITSDGLTVDGNATFNTSTDTADNVVITGTDAGSSTAPDLVLFRNSSTPADNDNIGMIQFRGNDSADTARNYASIHASINDVTSTSIDGKLNFSVATANTSAPSSGTTFMTIDGGGDISFYEDTGTTAQMTWDASADALTFTDNTKAIFGAGSDLQIYHDGSDSYVDDAGVGDLVLRGNNQVLIRDKATNDVMVNCRSGQFVKLYYNNAEKLATTSTGIDVTGTVTADGLTVDGNATISTAGSTVLNVEATGANDSRVRINAGASNISYVEFADPDDADTGEIRYDHNTNSMQFRVNGNQEAITIDSNKNVGIGTSSPEHALHVNGGTANTVAQFQSTDSNAYIEFLDSDAGASGCFIGGAGDDFVVLPNASEKFRVTSSGNVGIGNSSPLGKLTISNAAGANAPTTVTAANTYLQLGSDDYGASSNGKFMIGFGYTDATNTNSPAYIGYEETSSSGDTKGELTFYTRDVITDTAPTERMRIDSSGSVFVEQGKSIGWRYQVSGTHRGSISCDSADNITFANGSGASERMRIDGSGNVGIGTSSPDYLLEVETVSSSVAPKLGFRNTQAGTQIGMPANTNALAFFTGDNERMRIDSSGNLLVGTTNTTPFDSSTEQGTVISDGQAQIAGTSIPLYLNRQASDGAIANFSKDGSTVGRIGTRGGDIFIGGDTNLRFTTSDMRPCDSNGYNQDNFTDLGDASARFDDIFATNATIQTSDRNEKQDIEALTDAETRVAVAAKGLLRKFRWQSAVEEKGDEARTHFGIIAQDLQDAFTAEGLDASDYAMFCSDTWTDDDGLEQTRLGVRYSELLAFIIAGI